MELKTEVSFSKEEEGKITLNVNLPKQWQDLTQGQLHYICTLMCLGIPMEELKIYAFIRMAGFDVINKSKGRWNFRKKITWRKSEYFSLSDEIVASAASNLSYLDEYPSRPIRVERFGSYNARDAFLHNIPFKDFISLENYWQGFLISKKEECIERMAGMLYRKNNGDSPKKPNGTMCTSTALWYAAFKNFCHEHWPYFFKLVNKDDKSGMNNIDMEKIMNAEIRALTDGDVTKEKEVLNLDTWRALTELDAKAKEAEEHRQEIANIKAKQK